VDRLTRKELKTDKFAKEVEHTLDFLGEHRQQTVRYGSIGLAVLLLAVGGYFYRQHERNVRQETLRSALRIEEANVGQGSPGSLTFPTVEEKDRAAQKAFTELATRFSSSSEGILARYYLGVNAADKGKLDEAVKNFREVADSSEKGYASLAKLALAQIYQSQGKLPDAEKLLRSVIDHPTVLVSKEEATIALARLIAPTRPDEARKLLEPLRTDRTAVSAAAVQALGEIAQTQRKQ
jgi:predicted negative regulator of RcsB-dependent stress response